MDHNIYYEIWWFGGDLENLRCYEIISFLNINNKWVLGDGKGNLNVTIWESII